MRLGKTYFPRFRWCVLPVIFTLIVIGPAIANAQTFLFSGGGGTINLQIETATAGSEPNSATDNFTELSWDADYGVTSKVTVTTTCPSQNFSLFVELTVTTYGTGSVGTEQGEIELINGMLDTDMLRDIPLLSPGRVGSGTLTYRAVATVSDGNSNENGDDVHTVTYTLTAQ